MMVLWESMQEIQKYLTQILILKRLIRVFGNSKCEK